MTPISWLLPLLASIPAIVLAAPTPVAPIHRVERRAESGGFIVKFKPSAVPKENRLVWVNNQLRRAGCQPLTTTQAEGLKLGWSEEVFDGFAGSFDSCPNAIDIIRTSGDVEYISEDGESWLTEITTQNNAPWGLQRLSQQSPLGRTDDGETNFVYTFDDSAGEGVDIYIVDTGVQVDHPEFGGRAQFLETFGTGVPGVDVHGHGTHVAGIAGSQTYGVAKNANIFAVKVMSDSGRGDTSNIIAGVNFAVGRAFTTNRRRPSIINISIISNRTPALDEAVANAARLGVHVIVGSGNDNVDASNFSPARSPDAITVGATNIRDQKASFSNFGAPVDIFAPGENILSLAPGSTTQVLSGTSMATPFISGLVAYIIALEGDQTPAAMKARIQNLSSPGLIAAVPNGTLNELAWNGAQVAQEAPPAAAPTQQVSGPNQAQIQLVLNSVDGVLESLRALSDAASRAEL